MQNHTHHSWSFHLHTIWLFTYSDLKTIIFPSTLFAILHALALLRPPNTPLLDHLPQILTKALFATLWTYLNLLPFAISNQRQPSSVLEDTLNKPWRPMPSRRLSHRSATRLMLALYALAVLVSAYLGALSQSIALIVLGICYNNLGGADISFITRNAINGLGFVCFSSGALQVLLNGDIQAMYSLSWWFAIIACVVFTTVHTQDMYDQEGDAARGRKTVPLVLGDGVARWTIAVAMAVWSLVCPWLWVCGLGGHAAPVTLGVLVSSRTLMLRGVEEDKGTFWFWTIWMVGLYAVPLCAGTRLQ